MTANPELTITADMPIRPSMAYEQELRRRRLCVVRSLPRELFNQASERQCQENHSGQTLERLRERHGFSAREALAVLSAVPFEAFEGVSEETAMRALYQWNATFIRGICAGKAQRRA